MGRRQEKIMDYKLILLLIGTALACINYFFYLRGVFRGEFKPHMFTWTIWALICAIAFAAQFSENAGYGMYQTGLMMLGTAAIAIVACFKGDTNYTRSDWTALLFSLSAIPLWIVTEDPVWSVILITIIDVVASWPTYRKSWADPMHESPRAFFTAAVICALSIAALSVFNITTMLYTGAVTLVNLSIAVMILWRRQVLRSTA